MVATLLWKEYREQRALWLAIVVLAVVLVVILTAVLDAPVRTSIGPLSPIAVVVMTLTIAHGVVCGALLLAGDRETNTLSFLDVHVSRRFVLWKTKAVAGVGLSLAQGFVLAAVMLLFDPSPWPVAVVLP